MTLVLDGVKKKYSRFELDCSMQVESGTVTGLIGRNGVGKSTTFKSVLCLVKPDAGTITINGTEAHKLTNREKEDIGVVLAETGFSGYLTVKDVSAMMAAMYSRFDKNEFAKKCEHFRIPMNQKIKEFSTGMKAKLKVLAALSHEAKLLVLDEPTAGLDVVARDEILDMLREYMENEENSILISSHISTDLEGLCDDIYLIDDGKIVLHEETNVLLDEYGVLKVTEEQFAKLEKSYILCSKKEPHGYSCLTNQKQFYQENYPDVVIEKGDIDSVIGLMIADKRGGR